MVGASRFTFMATALTRYTVFVSANGVQVLSETGRTQPGRSRSWEAKFSEVSSATIDNWSTRRGTGEALYLHRKGSEDVVFMSTIRPNVEAVTPQDRDTYEAAAAAVFRALATARPNLRVRKGPAPGTRILIAVILAIMTALITSLFLWQSSGVSESYRSLLVGIILVMMALHAIYRTRLFKAASFASVQEVAAETASRISVVGPWGAIPRT